MTIETGLSARVLLVGKRPRILDECGNALRDVGMIVQQETDVDRVCNGIDGSSVDIVTLGQGIRGQRRERVIESLRTRNPSVTVIEPLAPIPELVAAQVQQAVTASDYESRIVQAAAYEVADNSIVLLLRQPAHVSVTLHRLDPLCRVHRRDIFVGSLDFDRQQIPLGRKIGHGDRFLVVEADHHEVTVHNAD